MAVQYVVTEEEMLSLLDQLKLKSFEANNILHADSGKPPTRDEVHRAFHYVVVRWAQSMGFKGWRE